MRFAKVSINHRVALALALLLSIGGAGRPASRAVRTLASQPTATARPLAPTQPGANGKIAFTSERDGNAEIYTMNPDGSNQMNLTKNPALDATPVWSPDGAKIAFTSNRTGRLNLYVMNADGSGVTKITKNDDGVDFRIYDPAWSPDGKRLAYVASLMGEISSLSVVNADGSGATARLEPTSTEVADPEWSPDGTRIAFTGREASNNFMEEGIQFYLFVANADGSGKTRIGDYPLRFASFFPQALGSGPTWSPDGTLIAYSYDNESAPTQQPRRVADLFVVRASGGGVRFLTEHSAQDLFPSWSPDGTRVAFTSDRDGHREIYVVNSDGGQPTRITQGSAANYDPNWQSLNSTLPPPAQCTVQFRSPAFRVRESGQGGDPLIVTRLGDLSQEASVAFTTSDCPDALNAMCVASASERSDYTTTSGSLRFAPGEASKTISVPLINDAFVEGDESFYLQLSSPVGCGLGGSRTATVAIADNDTSPSANNPVDDASFFIRQHYLDFLNREPEPGGFQGWLDILNSCPADATYCDQVEVSSAFYRSAEFQQGGYFTYRFYAAALGRVPHFGEFMPDLARVSGFQTAEQLEASRAAFIEDFAARPEFKARYESLTDPAAYVNAILNTAGISLPQKQALIDDLAAGRRTRAGVLRAIVESAEVYRKFYNEAFVVMQYFGYLRRDPDILYLEWIKTLDRTGDYRVMINGFIKSDEYRSRFGQP
ncbi:MAG TPA: Calx-beta domain-containing protein [Pyrinomonadaceae bacterium]|nr:Calx-beta domain-containing protein [Pyrinomonadaceae bacterium]